MTAAGLLAQLRSAGITATREGDRIRLRGAGARDHAGAVRAHRDEILALLAGERAAGIGTPAQRMASLIGLVADVAPGAKIACATCGESMPTYGGSHPSCASCTYGKGYSATSAGARAALESRGIATAATLAAWPEIGRRPRKRTVRPPKGEPSGELAAWPSIGRRPRRPRR